MLDPQQGEQQASNLTKSDTTAPPNPRTLSIHLIERRLESLERAACRPPGLGAVPPTQPPSHALNVARHALRYSNLVQLKTLDSPHSSRGVQVPQSHFLQSRASAPRRVSFEIPDEAASVSVKLTLAPRAGIGRSKAMHTQSRLYVDLVHSNL
eukprot:m.277703 g.277703  ORF g.277703 m.277703 type:complete len:153 (-) comp54879_c0_seq2:1437-1895(-)